MHHYLIELRRPAKQAIMIASDAIIIAFIVWLAFALRLGQPFSHHFMEVWWLTLLVPAVAIPCLAFVGLYRIVLRYLGPKAVVAVIKGVTLATFAFIALVAALRVDPNVPRTAYILFWVLAVFGVGGSRFGARAIIQVMLNQRPGCKRVAIYGAGEAGVQLATSLASSREYHPVLFVDDDPRLVGAVVNGLKVHMPGSLPRLVRRELLEEVLLAMPSVSRSRRREIVERLESLSVPVRTLPAMYDILSGKARIDDVREVEVDDLLGRDPVTPVDELMDRCIKGKQVLVTGAGGSIGSELCRQIIQRRPGTLVLFEQNEFSLYQVERELRELVRRQKLKVRVIPLLGSVVHHRRLERVMRAYHINTVYHAAAYKHVPMVEENVLEGVQNNIMGTLHAAQAAQLADVDTFVLISTDKAVRPTNVMGATKRFAELVLQGMAAEGRGSTCFCMVRFGNVLGSSGSVVPLFRQQIAAGGPVTVTHPEVTRFFMTISEAATLVIQAGAMAEGGDVFVLDMGDPVSIHKLARQMIHLSGLEVKDDVNPDGDIAITFTGLRPGEKLYEELLVGNNPSGTCHPMIMRAHETLLPMALIDQQLHDLQAACENFNPEVARTVLEQAVGNYQAKGTTHDLLWRQINGAQQTEREKQATASATPLNMYRNRPTREKAPG